MTDGTFPARSADDPLLPDRERLASDADIRLTADQPGESYRDYLAALASAGERIVTFARGDQRQGREQRPSRWLLDSLQALGATTQDAQADGAATEGQPASTSRLFSSDLERLRPLLAFTVIPSFTAEVRADGEPISPADWDLRSLLRWKDDHGRIDDHFLVGVDHVLGLGVTTRTERRSSRFSRFDGKIDTLEIPSPTAGTAQSPTGLESYARCPRSYLFDKLLRITVREKPEDIWQIEASAKGTVIHEILERFIGEEVSLPRAERIRPQTPWSAAKAERIQDLATEVFTKYQQAGVTGRPLLWALDKAAIRRDLSRFLVEDNSYRSAKGVVPEAVELAFGPGPGLEAEVVVDLGGERTVNFKGKGDRVDQADNGLAIITDYKTGQPWGADKKLQNDPVDRGQKLQLPVYGLAARSRLGDVPVEARYWFVNQKAGFKPAGYELTDERLDRFREVVGTIVDGVEAGLFPANPGGEDNLGFEHCRFCDFKPICPGDRDRAWQRVRTDPVLEPYVRLAEPAGEEP